MTKTIKKLGLLCLTMLLVSCTSKPYNDLEPPPMIVGSPPAVIVQPEPVKAAPIQLPTSIPSDITNILYKSFLYPSDKLNQELVTFIYLPRKPITEKELNQYLSICKIWLGSLSYKEELIPHYDSNKENLVPFYWPVKVKLNNSTCLNMIEHYDYPRMSIMMQRNKLNTNKVQFVSMYKTLNVKMDISSLHKDEDLVNSMAMWIVCMTKIPDKSEELSPVTLVDTLKKLLGVLGNLVTTNLKG